MTRRRALHPAERKYLLDAARGLTAAETAKHYGVAASTVRTALALGKLALGARTIAHATALCLTFGEFTTDDVMKGTES